MGMVVKRFTFAAAHRLMHHRGKCQFLHGHNWAVEVGVRKTAKGLMQTNKEGMILDFQELNGRVGTWIESFFDHNILLNKEDPIKKTFKELGICRLSKPFLFDGDPTVENIGGKLVGVIVGLLWDVEVEICFLKIYETESSYYEWRV